MSNAIADVVAGRTHKVPLGARATDPTLIFPGSFNPLHSGHQRMAAAASQRSGSPVAFELSVLNVDKPSLTVDEIHARVSQFPSHCTIWITRAPTFVEKASLFPGCAFIIGADTAARLFSPKYFPSAEAMEASIQSLIERQCRFLVFGRLLGGRFTTVPWEKIPRAAQGLFEIVPEQDFRDDVSSTDLRNKGIGLDDEIVDP